MSKVVRIGARQSLSDFIMEVWEYRELFLTFAWRDFRVRYAQTFLGVSWALVQPIMTIFILWLVFGRFVKVDMQGVPPLAFIASGVSVWTYFSFVLTQSGQSIIQSQEMVKKVFFPKIILPMSKAFLGLVDLITAQIVLVVILLVHHNPFSVKILFVPLLIISLILITLGLGIWISAITIKYRDIQQLLPFVIQMGVYITPVAYPAEVAQSFLPEWAQVLYYLNPLAGIIEMLRYCLFDVGAITYLSVFSLAAGLLLFLGSVIYFQRTQRKIADVI